MILAWVALLIAFVVGSAVLVVKSVRAKGEVIEALGGDMQTRYGAWRAWGTTLAILRGDPRIPRDVLARARLWSAASAMWPFLCLFAFLWLAARSVA